MKQSMKRLTADQVKVGFIGLGNMGSRIATRLLDRGYQLSVYDMDPAKAEAIAAHGGEATKNILELARAFTPDQREFLLGHGQGPLCWR